MLLLCGLSARHGNIVRNAPHRDRHLPRFNRL
jgi:hypothetical protein